MGDLWWIWGIFFFFIGVIPFVAVILPAWISNINSYFKRRRQERMSDKIKHAKVKTELEIQKKKAEFEIEKQRMTMKPKYCPYCGSRHDGQSERCSNCGADL